MEPAEIKRLNGILLPLLPTLKERLEMKFGRQLDEVIDKCDFKNVTFASDKDAEISDELIDEIEQSFNAYYGLDMPGWDSITFEEMFSDEQKAELKEVLANFAKTRSTSHSLKKLIKAMHEPRFPEENRDNIAFFVYGAISESDLPDELACLWILREGGNRYAYMFEIEIYVSLNQCWRLCEDILPPEIALLLDLEWVE